MAMADVSLWLLGLAIVVSWWPSPVRSGADSGWVAPWMLLLAAAVLVGLAGGVLSGVGLLPLLAFMCMGWWAQHDAAARWPAMALGVMALALALHAFPGFHRMPVFEAVQLSPDAPPVWLGGQRGQGPGRSGAAGLGRTALRFSA